MPVSTDIPGSLSFITRVLEAEHPCTVRCLSAGGGVGEASRVSRSLFLRCVCLPSEARVPLTRPFAFFRRFFSWWAERFQPQSAELRDAFCRMAGPECTWVHLLPLFAISFVFHKSSFFGVCLGEDGAVLVLEFPDFLLDRVACSPPPCFTPRCQVWKKWLDADSLVCRFALGPKIQTAAS